VLHDVAEAIDSCGIERVQRSLRHIYNTSGTVEATGRRQQVGGSVRHPVAAARPGVLNLCAARRLSVDGRDRFECLGTAGRLINDLAHLNDLEKSLARAG
jgi:hypothetical protein